MDTGAPLKQQLESAETMLEATTIIRTNFTSKLHRKLHIPQGKTISPDTQLADLGVDSVVAVDLRMWFAKSLDIDMPVLEILSGSSIDQIVSNAAAKVKSGSGI